MLGDALIWFSYIAVFIWLARKGQGHDAMASGRVGFVILALAYVVESVLPRPLATGIALVLAALLLLQGKSTMKVQLSVWIWLLCGVLWGIGLIAPGMSPSSLFIFMGVYQPMAAGIGAALRRRS